MNREDIFKVRFRNVVTYMEVYSRMKKLDMIEKYIYPNYETLHTESRENAATFTWPTSS